MRLRIKNFNGQAVKAFSLIEILVVITIIAILATLGLTVSGSVNKRKTLSRTTAEMKQIMAAIDDFNSRLGYVPRDNPNNSQMHALYYELAGVDYVPDDPSTGGTNEEGFATLDKQKGFKPAQVQAIFFNAGFDNARQPGSPLGKNVLQVQPRQIGQLQTNPPAAPGLVTVDVLLVPGKGTNVFPGVGGTELNLWHYRSTNPQHNPKSYDLWADLLIGTKIIRVCNWGKGEEVLRE